MTDLDQIDYHGPLLSPSELAAYKASIKRGQAKRNAIERRMREAKKRGYEARNTEAVKDETP